MNENEKRKLYEGSLSEIKRKIGDLADIKDRMNVVCEILKKDMPYYFWVGFYYLKKDFLLLGPSQGPPVCAQIPALGVCGAAVKRRQTVIVPNVHEFEGHHACDARSNSEIVIPIFCKGEVIAVLDVDSEELGAFDETDKVYLERIISHLGNIDKIHNFK